MRQVPAGSWLAYGRAAVAGRGVLIEVFERFTDRARRVVVLAQEEARMLNHRYIGAEHILLGLGRRPLETARLWPLNSSV